MSEEENWDKWDSFPLDLYKKGKVLGKGGLAGSVKKYHLNNDCNQRLPKVVAVKNINKEKLTDGQEYKVATHGHDVILDELNQKNHENLVKIYGIVRDKDKVKVVMEKCDCTLKYLINTRRLTLPELAFIMVKLLTGLDFLHKENIMHRDIKPSNVLIKTHQKNPHWKTLPIHEMSIKLADYDFVRHFSDTDPGDTVSMSTVGTRKYMAPEIDTACKNKVPNAHYTWSADIYSLGLVCFEMFRGKLVSDYEYEHGIPSIIRADSELRQIRSLHEFIQLQIAFEKRSRSSAEDLLTHDFLKLAEDGLEAEQEMKAQMNLLGKEISLPPGKRLKRHVQILLVGETGVGKTATIKHLIGHNKDLEHFGLKTSGYSSMTRETVEYILTSTGKANNTDPAHSISFGIVDTPGLDDTDGLEQDARNLACLKAFLVDENKNKSPNLVLLFLRADGTRDIGPASVLAKSINVYFDCGKDSMGLTQKGDNVVIVLTHALNITQHSDKVWKDLASKKTRAIRRFVLDQTGWNIPVVLLENDPPESRMPTKGDWTKLPNGQLQPKNLFDAIANVFKQTGDVDSKRVVESYFARSCRDSTVRLRKGPYASATTSGEFSFDEKMFYNKLSGSNPTGMGHAEKVSMWIEKGGADANESVEEENDAIKQEDNELDTEEQISFEGCDLSDSLVKEALDEIIIGKGYNICGDGEIVDCFTFNENAILDQIERFKCSRTEWKNLDIYNKFGIFKSTGSFKQDLDKGHAMDESKTGSRVLKVLTVRASPSDKLKSNWMDEFYLSDGFSGDLKKLPEKYSAKNKSKFQKFFKNRGHAFVSNSYYGGEMRLLVDNSSNMNNTGEVVAFEQLSAEEQGQFRGLFGQDLDQSSLMKDVSVEVSFRGGAPEHRYRSPDGVKEWKESVPNNLTGLILNPDSDLIFYHDFVRDLPWMDDGERKKKAQALQDAYEDLCVPGRKDVVRGEILRNIITATAKKLNPFSWKW